MKKINVLLAFVILIAVGSAVQAQGEISDEDLRRYAVTMNIVDVMKSEISVITNKMIKDQEGMTGKRYKELSKAKGDESKLTEMGAKEFEKKFMMLLTKKQEERKSAIKDVLSSLATKMLPNNGKTYKAIKAGLKDNEDLKTRYEKIKSVIASGQVGA